MKIWHIFVAVLLFKVFIQLFVPYYTELPNQTYDLTRLDLSQANSSLDASTSTNQYLEQSLYFRESYRTTFLDNLLGAVVTPLGSWVESLIPFENVFPSLLVSLLNMIYYVIATISILEFFRGFQII